MRAWRTAVLWLGAGAYFAAAIAWLGSGRPPTRELFDDGSVYNTSPSGLSLAYRYLADGPGVGGGKARIATLARLVDPDQLPPDAVVFRVRPRVMPFLRRSVRLGEGGGENDRDDEAPKKKVKKPAAPRESLALLTPREEEWIRRGGRLVLALAGRYGAANVESTRGEVRKVFPIWPGVGVVEPTPARALTGYFLGRTHTVLAAGDRPLASLWPLGKGEMILLACPEVLENRSLGLADHLGLLEALAGGARPVYFDEYVHGLQDEAGMLDLLARWRLGPALALLALTGLLVLWRGRVRVGPEEDDYEETRSDAVDLLDSLAQLYDRAVRRDEALVLYHESLSRAVAFKSGLRGAALAARVRSLAGDAPPPRRRGAPEPDIPLAGLARSLRAINEGFRRSRHAEPK